MMVSGKNDYRGQEPPPGHLHTMVWQRKLVCVFALFVATFLGAVLLVGTALWGQAPGQERVKDLFLDVPAEHDISASQRSAIDGLRQDKTTGSIRLVRVQVDLLKTEAVVALKLPNNIRIEAVRTRIETTGDSSFVWYGKPKNQAGNI